MSWRSGHLVDWSHYTRSMRKHARQQYGEWLAAADGKSLSALLERLNVKELPANIVARYDPSGRSTFNANSPEDWREALAIYAEESSASSEWM